MPFIGIVLYPAKQNQRGWHEDQREDIMIDGACPRKSISPSKARGDYQIGN